MPDNIPFEIESEIMKRIPVKSLLRFRSVSKSCKSLIESSHFIKRYIGQQQHLLVNYPYYEQKYVSIVDDDNTFPLQNVSPILPPLLVRTFWELSIIGSSHGLLCLYDSDPNISLAVLWNPSVIGVAVPNMENTDKYWTVIGFGVCREINDPKIVSMTRFKDMESISCTPWQVEVFTLSSGAWRTLYSTNLPRRSIDIYMDQVVVDGRLYCFTTYGTSESSRHHLIISFDITSEEFKELSLPDSLATCNDEYYLIISKLRNSLVVLKCNQEEMLYDVWMMEDGVSKSFTKIFTICRPDDVATLYVLEFRKIGEPLIEVGRISGRHIERSLAVYEPNSKHINNLGVYAGYLHHVKAYMETLLLLNKPDNFIYGYKTQSLEYLLP